GIALVEKEVLENMVRGGDCGLGVTELECLQAVDVAALAVRMQARLRFRERLFGSCDRVERLVAHVDQIERLGGRLLVPRHDGGDRVPDVTHVLRGERVFVLRNRQDAEGNREVATGQYKVHARMGARTRSV